MPVGGGERPERLLFEEVALVVERAEEILGDPIVVRRRGSREQVVREPQSLHVLPDEPVEPVRRLRGRLSRGVGRDHDRRAVLVRAADHQHVVPSKAVITSERVRGDAKPRHVADVAQAARIWPGDCDQDLPR
jgi:hypothetical protein